MCLKPGSLWKKIMNGLKYYIDTNIFLRVVAKDDRYKLLDCERLVENIKSGKIAAITSSLVLAEVVWTCQKAYRLDKAEVKDVLKSILSIKNLKFRDKQQLFTAADLFEKHNVKFIDCLIASQPDIAAGRMPVVSYDREFDRMGIKRAEPKDLI